jgi:hypothetical protein
MTYKAKKIENQQNHYEITMQKDGSEIIFNVVVVSEDQLDEVIQCHLDFLDGNAPAYTPTYSDLRKAAYPSFADQFDLLYHGGYDAWKASIDAVKTQFPKT